MLYKKNYQKVNFLPGFFSSKVIIENISCNNIIRIKDLEIFSNNIINIY